MSDNIAIGSVTPILFTSSPTSHATITNAGPATVYYLREESVSSSHNEGSLVSGQSVTYDDGPRWFISVGSSRLFSSYSPDATTEMATHAELEALSTGFDTEQAKALIEELGVKAGLSEAEIEALITKSGGLTEAQIKKLIEETAGHAGLTEAEVEALIGTLNEGAIETTIAKTGFQIFNVKKYGAKGDGVTDDYAAILATFEAMEAAGGGTVYRPPAAKGKSYLISKPLTIDYTVGWNTLGHAGRSVMKLTSDVSKWGEAIYQPKSENATPVRHVFLEDYLEGPSNWPHSPTAGELKGYYPNLAMGFTLMSNSIAIRCKALKLYAGFANRSLSNGSMRECEDGGCFIGIYFAGIPLAFYAAAGGLVVRDHKESVPTWAGISIGPHTKAEGNVIDYMDCAHAPYVIYKEGPKAQQSSMLAPDLYDVSGQEGGNGFYYGGDINSGLEMKAKGLDINLGAASNDCVGNVQVLTITATGGHYKLVLPATPSGFAGATTAAISWNASNTEVKTAIEAVAGGAKAAVTTVESTKKQIYIYNNKAVLLGTAAITLETGELTGGSATITEPAVDPFMGPVCRPVTAQKVVVKNATGGKFTLTVAAEGETLTTAEISFNATKVQVAEALAKLANVTVWGVAVEEQGATGTYFVCFVGRLLYKSVTLTATNVSLTGSSPEVVVEAGSASTMKPRVNEYAIDGGTGACVLNFDDEFLGLAFGTKGLCRVIKTLTAKGKVTESLLTATESGSKVLCENTTTAAIALEQGESSFIALETPGPIAKGQLIAWNGSRAEQMKGVLYPKVNPRQNGGNVAASEVETVEIEHLLGEAPVWVELTVEQATPISVSVTERGTSKIKVKFGSKTASGAKLLWRAGTNALMRPHAGFASGAIAEGNTQMLIVQRKGRIGNVTSDAPSGGTSEHRLLKPSAENAGSTQLATDPSDLVVGLSTAKLESGNIPIVVLGT